MATATGLAVAKINSLKKLSIHATETGESSVTRLAYCPVNKVVAAGVIKRHMSKDTGDIEQRAMLEIRDPVSMQGASARKPICSFCRERVVTNGGMLMSLPTMR